MRGNLDTRLAKLDRGEYAAIILAAAGLERLGLGSRIRGLLSPDDSLPAAGQGALGIEVKAGRPDLEAWLAPLADADTTAAATAERAVSRKLGGSCQVPLAAYAEIADGVVWLRALVARPDGRTVIRRDARAPVAEAEQLGLSVADALLRDGAADILAALAIDH